MSERCNAPVAPECIGDQSDPDVGADFSIAQTIHSLLRFLLAVRYRKKLVAAVMVAAVVIGGLYYYTAVPMYGSKAGLLVSYAGRDSLNTSMTNEESMRQNTMPTSEGMIRSAKVLEAALQQLAPEDRVDLEGSLPEKWVGILRTNMATKVIRSTSILEVNYKSKSPQAAANVVRAMVQSYLDFMDRMHKGTTDEVGKVLVRERNSLADQLSRRQQELLETRRQFADMGFRSDGSTLHPMVQRAVFFNDSLIAVQKQRLEQQATLAAIRIAMSKGEGVGLYVMGAADTVGRDVMLGSLGLSASGVNAQATMENALVAAQADFQSMQQNLGPRHPDVVALAEKIRSTEQYLASFQTRLGERLVGLQGNQLGPWLIQVVQQKVDESSKKERILQSRFEDARSEAINLSGKLAQVELLERDVKRLSNLNDVLLNQIAAIDLKQNGPEVRVAVIEEPAVAKSPLSPRLSYIALLSLAGGFGVALGLVTLLDTLDDRFRSLDELQSRLGISALTMIPHLAIAEGGGLTSLPSYLAPSATESESFRTLRTALMLAHQDARRIVITSSEPGDGKSTVLANLGVCYAQAEKRTLLIDADLRRPGLTNLLNMRGTRGLSEVLRSDGDIEQAATAHIRTTEMPYLDVLPSGPRPTDPGELLGGPRLLELLAWAETVYDQILIDSPPTLAATDTAVIGRLVDGAMIVVQPAKNRRRLVTRTVERLGFMKIPILGLIINHAKEASGYYGYGYGGYGYGYGYGYQYNYGADDHQKNAGKQAADADRETIALHDADADARVNDGPENDNRRTLTIPRRVA